MVNKRSGTLKTGHKIANYDHYYGQYKSIGEAKKALKDVALEGRQFVVKQQDGSVKLYLWQGKDKEPTEVGEGTTSRIEVEEEVNNSNNPVSSKAVKEAIDKIPTDKINIDSISTTQTAEQLNALADGLYFANGAGVYNISISNPTTGVTVANGKTTVASGYSVSFNKKGNVWSLASSVVIPAYDDNAINTRISTLENKQIDGDFFTIKNKTLSNSGNLNNDNSNSYNITPYIDIQYLQSLKVQGFSNSNILLYAFYDKDKVFINGVGGTSFNNKLISISKEEIPLNAKYIVCCGDAKRQNKFEGLQLVNYLI